jgi:hypothetical protein
LGACNRRSSAPLCVRPRRSIFLNSNPSTVIELLILLKRPYPAVHFYAVIRRRWIRKFADGADRFATFEWLGPYLFAIVRDLLNLIQMHILVLSRLNFNGINNQSHLVRSSFYSEYAEFTSFQQMPYFEYNSYRILLQELKNYLYLKQA